MIVYVKHHAQPRKNGYWPEPGIVDDIKLTGERVTIITPCTPEGVAEEIHEKSVTRATPWKKPFLWTGCTYLFSYECTEPDKVLSMVSKTRNKGEAKNSTQCKLFVP